MEPGLDLKKVLECMGDPEADADNAVLSKEQEDQVRQTQRPSCPSTLNLSIVWSGSDRSWS
jgi:hypothetical protein